MIDIQGIPVVAARLAAAQKASSTQTRKKTSSRVVLGKVSVGPRSTLRTKAKVA